MSRKTRNQRKYSFRLNLDELTPEELYTKLKKKSRNDALKEARWESGTGGYYRKSHAPSVGSMSLTAQYC